MRDPRFMNPIGAPEPSGDSGRIVWGVFVLPAGEVLFLQRVRASAPAGVAPEPPGDSGRIAWGVFWVASGGIFILTVGGSGEVSSQTQASGTAEGSGEADPQTVVRG